MDVPRLTNVVNVGNRQVLRGQNRVSKAVKSAVDTSVPELDKKNVSVALDKIIRNTRFKYDIKDELGYFVVKIIDSDTNKIVREIPSKEFQRTHGRIEEILGTLFDERI